MSYDVTLAALAISAVLSSLVALLADLLLWFRRRRIQMTTPSPKALMEGSIQKLSEASKEMNKVVQEIIEEAKTRETALETLRARYESIAREEERLAKRVETLKDVPIEAARYFEEISRHQLEQAEKRMTRRDIVFFLLGTALTTAIAIVLRISGIG